MYMYSMRLAAMPRRRIYKHGANYSIEAARLLNTELSLHNRIIPDPASQRVTIFGERCPQ